MGTESEAKRSVEDHRKVVKKVLPIASALPADSVKEPDIPVDVFLREAKTVNTGCVEHKDALVALGVTQEMFDTAVVYVDALDSAETIWQAERKGAARREKFAAIIDEAEEVRTDALDAGELALRKSQEGKERMSRIREDDGLEDLASDMGDVAALLTDARHLFEAINYPVDETSTRTAELRDLIRKNLSAEDVGKTLSAAKDTRDRVFTLADEAISEIRSYAKFAFRKDRSPSRKNLFTSDYNRRRNQRRRRAAAQERETSISSASKQIS